MGYASFELNMNRTPGMNAEVGLDVGIPLYGG